MKRTHVQQGDIYKLGDHLLACGSSLDKKFVDNLVDNRKVRMILTDPPYGVGYVETAWEGKIGLANTTGGVRNISNDQIQTEDQYATFTASWLDAIKEKLEHYNTCYIFNSDLMFCALRDGMKRSGFFYSQMLIWLKNTVVIGRKDYLPMHEVIAYGWFGRHKPERSKAKSVIFHPKPASSKLHPTMKPVGLLRKIVPNSTKVGEWIYDPFGGSGSTLIACEHLKRRCIMVEMDPLYVSTIIARWEELSGNKAIKI